MSRYTKNQDARPLSAGPARGLAHWLPGAAIAAATPVLVWFAMGDPPVYASWRFGPYDVGPQPATVVAVGAGIVAATALGALVMRTRRGTADLQSWAVVFLLAVAGALGSAGWRGQTSTYSGADIGGPLEVLVVPLVISGLLVGAAVVAGTQGRWTRRRTWLTSVAAMAVAPALWGALYALAAYDDAAGFITSAQYARVHVGQSRAAVHELLGRESRGDDFAYEDFPHTPAGQQCDYYRELAPGQRWFQFCFAAGVLASKDVTVLAPDGK